MTYLEGAWRDGRAVADAKLARSLATNPEHPPHGAAVLVDNTFAGACYNENTIADLDLTGCKKSNHADRRAWDNITAYDWAYQIGMAYAALTWRGGKE